jgi:hypothetical protein
MLVPGETMTCHGTYLTAAADVAAGQAGDVAIATGRPSTGPSVSDRDLAIIVALPVVPVTG